MSKLLSTFQKTSSPLEKADGKHAYASYSFPKTGRLDGHGNFIPDSMQKYPSILTGPNNPLRVRNHKKIEDGDVIVTGNNDYKPVKNGKLENNGRNYWYTENHGRHGRRRTKSSASADLPPRPDRTEANAPPNQAQTWVNDLGDPADMFAAIPSSHASSVQNVPVGENDSYMHPENYDNPHLPNDMNHASMPGERNLTPEQIINKQPAPKTKSRTTSSRRSASHANTDRVVDGRSVTKVKSTKESSAHSDVVKSGSAPHANAERVDSHRAASSKHSTIQLRRHSVVDRDGRSHAIESVTSKKQSVPHTGQASSPKSSPSVKYPSPKSNSKEPSLSSGSVSGSHSNGSPAKGPARRVKELARSEISKQRHESKTPPASASGRPSSRREVGGSTKTPNPKSHHASPPPSSHRSLKDAATKELKGKGKAIAAPLALSVSSAIKRKSTSTSNSPLPNDSPAPSVRSPSSSKPPSSISTSSKASLSTSAPLPPSVTNTNRKKDKAVPSKTVPYLPALPSPSGSTFRTSSSASSNGSLSKLPPLPHSTKSTNITPSDTSSISKGSRHSNAAHGSNISLISASSFFSDIPAHGRGRKPEKTKMRNVMSAADRAKSATPTDDYLRGQRCTIASHELNCRCYLNWE